MIPATAALAERGATYALVAGTLKITAHTLRRWLEEGRSDNCTDHLKEELAEAFDSGRARAIEEGIEVFQGHIRNDWRAADAWMKMLDRESFDPAPANKKVDVNINLNKPLDLSHATQEELDALEAAEQVKARLASGETRKVLRG